MDVTVLRVSYGVLAPVSLAAGVLMILLFVAIKDLRRFPGCLILWQCIGQCLLDLHWFSTSDLLSHQCFPLSENAGLCLFIGFVTTYAFVLACNYTACLSFFIIMHLRKPLRPQSRYSMWSFHAFCQTTAVTAALAVLASGDLGTSILTTCFLRSKSRAEFLLFLTLAVYFPLCVSAGVYSVLKYRSHITLRSYIAKHTLVVVAFAGAWFCTALEHLLNEESINRANSHSLANIAIVTGAASGLVTVTVRLLEPEILYRIGRLVRRKAKVDMDLLRSPQS